MKTTKLRKVFMALGAVVLTNGAFAQLQDEKNVVS